MTLDARHDGAPRAVFLAQRIWRRWVQFPYWLAACVWMQVTGRFFWFKSAPDWFVAWAASQPDDESGDSLQEFFDAANDERELRRKRKGVK